MHRIAHISIWVAIAAFASAFGAEAACIPIKTVNQLQNIQDNLSGDYCLSNDIDASSKTNFKPIGDQSNPFTGTLNGSGFTIRNLTIKSARQQVGLFGVASAATIQNLTLENINVTANGDFAALAAGALAGLAYADAPNTATIARVKVSGQVRCVVANCDAGGIVGALGGITGTNLLRDSSSTAAVTASRWVGGIVGIPVNATIRRTYATGAVRCTGTDCMAGGFVGRFQGGEATDTFAAGPVTATGDGFTRTGGWGALVETAFGIGTVVTR
jgi:hypothetical protein